MNYPHLFSERQIGHLTVRNRLMQTAHAKLYALNGTDSERDVMYQAARAKGGVGLMITGNRMVHPTSIAGSGRFAYGYVPEAVEADRRMTDAVHRHGAVIVAQLNHFGVNGASDALDDLRYLVGPSAVKSASFGEMPKPMSVEDIHEVTDWWARSAEYSKEGGFDGVEVHLAHGYLLNQFISPLYNRRTDEYGGSLENRLRFAREVIAEVRQRVGRDFIVGVRVPLSDCVDGGTDLEDAKAIISLLRGDGQIDYVNVTAGEYFSGLQHVMPPADTPEDWLLDRITEVKSTVPDLPVFAVGAITEPAQAERIIAEGRADMVAMTRMQIADPQFPNKLREGREAEIYRCVRGNQMCVGRTGRGMAVGCTVNPETGREGKFGAQEMDQAASPGNWVVVGGGPAGLKAAEMLAKRGHKVTLLERESELGGQVNLTKAMPGRERFGVIVEDLERQLEIHGVEVRTGTAATVESVTALTPDGVIVATGGQPARDGFSSVAPLVDSLPGADGDHVITGWDVIQRSAAIGKNVVVLDDDGSRQVAGIAELLLDGGAHVQLISRWNSLLPFCVMTLDQSILCRRLLGKGMEYRLNAWARGIEGSTVRIYDLYTGADHTLDGVDTVVLATGQVADDSLYHALNDALPNVHRVGDCVAPRRIDHAIYEGYLAGREIFAVEDRYILEGELERAVV